MVCLLLPIDLAGVLFLLEISLQAWDSKGIAQSNPSGMAV